MRMPRKQPLESMSKQEMYECQADPGSGRAVIRPLTAIFSFHKIGPRCCMCRQSNLSAGLFFWSFGIIKNFSKHRPPRGGGGGKKGEEDAACPLFTTHKPAAPPPQQYRGWHPPAPRRT